MVCQCLSINNIIIAAPKTGVTIANILIVKNKLIEINGSNILLFLNPGIDNVRLVINKFVKPTVELIPAKITPNIKISWLPKPVYLVLEEKGVTKVQPLVTFVLSEHFVK